MEASTASAPKLLDQMRGKIRLKHYKHLHRAGLILNWIKRFIVFIDKRQQVSSDRLREEPAID